jgi:hypothetical protein
LREHKLSRKGLVDPATAAKAGKIATVEGILTGTVTETPYSLEVFARFIDVDTSMVLAAADVYGEDLTPRTLKTLMEGLAWKFQRHFPLVEGFVMAKEGEHITTDLSEHDLEGSCSRRRGRRRWGNLGRHERNGTPHATPTRECQRLEAPRQRSRTASGVSPSW